MANLKEGLVVTLTQVDEHTIWINSNQDPFGKEVVFDDIDDVESQMMIAVADYFDLDLEFDEEEVTDDGEDEMDDIYDLEVNELDDYDEWDEEYV